MFRLCNRIHAREPNGMCLLDSPKWEGCDLNAGI